MALEPCLALQLRSAHARRQPCHAARQRLRTATCTAPCARSMVSVRARRTQKSAGPVGVEAAQRLPACEASRKASIARSFPESFHRAKLPGKLPSREASRKARFGMNVTRWREDDRIHEIGDRALCPLAEGCAKLCGIRVCVLSRGSPHSNGDGALLKGMCAKQGEPAFQWRRCPSQGYLASRRSGCMHGTMSNHHGRAQRRRSGSARSTRIWPCSPLAYGYLGCGCATPRCRLRSNQSHQTPSRHSGRRAAPGRPASSAASGGRAARTRHWAAPVRRCYV